MQFALVDAGHDHQSDVAAWRDSLSFETFSLMHRIDFMGPLSATFLDWMLAMLSGRKWMTKKLGRWYWAFKLRSTYEWVWINAKRKFEAVHFISKSHSYVPSLLKSLFLSRDLHLSFEEIRLRWIYHIWTLMHSLAAQSWVDLIFNEFLWSGSCLR